MFATPDCEVCARLKAQRNGLRAAYDETIRSQGKFSAQLTPEQYEATRAVAEEIWWKLEEVICDFENHRQVHQPRIVPHQRRGPAVTTIVAGRVSQLSSESAGIAPDPEKRSGRPAIPGGGVPQEAPQREGRSARRQKRS